MTTIATRPRAALAAPGGAATRYEQIKRDKYQTRADEIAADAAFMRKLAAERLIPESAAPPSTRPVSSTAEGDAPTAEEPVLSKAQLAELQAKKAVREKRQQKLQLRKQKAHDAKKSHANPMSAKKKKQKFSYHASSAADLDHTRVRRKERSFKCRWTRLRWRCHVSET
jgi:hypothetical protein